MLTCRQCWSCSIASGYLNGKMQFVLFATDIVWLVCRSTLDFTQEGLYGPKAQLVENIPYKE